MKTASRTRWGDYFENGRKITAKKHGERLKEKKRMGNKDQKTLRTQVAGRKTKTQAKIGNDRHHHSRSQTKTSNKIRRSQKQTIRGEAKKRNGASQTRQEKPRAEQP